MCGSLQSHLAPQEGSGITSSYCLLHNVRRGGGTLRELAATLTGFEKNTDENSFSEGSEDRTGIIRGSGMWWEVEEVEKLTHAQVERGSRRTEGRTVPCVIVSLSGRQCQNL